MIPQKYICGEQDNCGTCYFNGMKYRRKVFLERDRHGKRIRRMDHVRRRLG